MGDRGLPVAQHGDADGFLASLGEDSVGCVVSDVVLPGLTGVDLAARLRDRDLPLTVVLLSGEATLPMALQAIELGVLAFLEKPVDADALAGKAREGLAAALADRARRRERAELLRRRATLTPREREVMDLVARGLSNKVIARVLDLSHRTVEIHRGRMVEKMAAESLPDLVRMVSRLEE